MRILILHKFLVVGGIERTLLSYLPILNDLGYQTEIVFTYNLEHVGNHLQALLPKHQSVDYVFSTKQSKFLLTLQQQKKYSLFHKIGYECSRCFIQRKIIQKVQHKIKCGHYDLIIDFSGVLDKISQKKSWNIPLVRWMQSENDVQQIIQKPKHYQYYDKIIAITQTMYSHLVANTNLSHDKFYMMYHPLNLDEIQRKSLENVNIEHQDYFLVVSRLVEGKGLLELIDIYVQLKALGIKNKLYIIGEGELRAILQEKIYALSLEKDCFLLGAKNNPYPYFKAAKLFTFTSESEGLGMVILESMASAVPVVAMDCPTGPKEIIGCQNEYGRLVPLHNKAQFCEDVLLLLNDSEVYRHYQVQGLARSQDFSEANAKIALWQLFQHIQGNRSGIPEP